MRFITLGLLLLCSAMCRSQAPSNPSQSTTLPIVKAAETPIYPPLARSARIEGTVHLEVATDGQTVVAARGKGTNKMLCDAAEQNVRTWRFWPHNPTSFQVSFAYRIGKVEVEGQSNSKVVLEFPTSVEITTNAPKVQIQVSY